MMYGLDPVIFIGRVLLVVAAITTTAFPILYSFSPWYKSTLGQAMMVQAVTLALAIQLKMFLTFFAHSEARDTLLWINVATLVMIIIATSALTYLQWVLPRRIKKGELLMDSAPLISNKVYDILKPLTTIFLPGAGAMYFTLSNIWGWPASEQVVGSIAAINVFLGLFLGISSKAYNSSESSDTKVYAGSLDYSSVDGQKVVSFNIDPKSDADTWVNQKEVIFKINK